MGKLRRRLVLVIGTFVLLILILVLYISVRPQTIRIGDRTYHAVSAQDEGSLVINYNDITNQSGMVVELNQSPLKGQAVNQDSLPPGSFNLTVTDKGYKDFSQDFSVVAEQTTYVSVKLLPISPPSASNLNDIITNAQTSTPVSMASILPSETVVENVVYLDDNAWAIITANLKIGVGQVHFVAQYDSNIGLWIAVTNPDDDFDSSDISTLPTSVQNYIYNNYGVSDDN